MRRDGGMDICLPETRSVFASGVYWGHLDHLPKLNQAPARRPCALTTSARVRTRYEVRGLRVLSPGKPCVPEATPPSACAEAVLRTPTPVRCLVYPPVLESSPMRSRLRLKSIRLCALGSVCATMPCANPPRGMVIQLIPRTFRHFPTHSSYILNRSPPPRPSTCSCQLDEEAGLCGHCGCPCGVWTRAASTNAGDVSM
jgi:hypothetical protein